MAHHHTNVATEQFDIVGRQSSHRNMDLCHVFRFRNVSYTPVQSARSLSESFTVAQRRRAMYVDNTPATHTLPGITSERKAYWRILRVPGSEIAAEQLKMGTCIIGDEF